MKKLLILSIFISLNSIGQSIIILPASNSKSDILQISKNGIGLDHRSENNLRGIGTFVNNTKAFIQTHTNHPLIFSINDEHNNPYLILTPNGNVGLGIAVPTEKLHINRNMNHIGNFNSTNQINTEILNINISNISKYFEVFVLDQISSVPANECVMNYYTVNGVESGDAVILNIESGISTLSEGNVRVSGQNQVEVKFCNTGTTNTALLNNIALRFSVFRKI